MKALKKKIWNDPEGLVPKSDSSSAPQSRPSDEASSHMREVILPEVPTMCYVVTAKFDEMWRNSLRLRRLLLNALSGINGW